MGLFNKKLSLEEILKGIEALSEEEKAVLVEKMQDKPAEEVKETETVEEPIEEASNEETTNEEVVEETAEPTEETPATEPVEELNQVEENNQAEVIQQMTDRLSALEEKLASFEELKAKMEEFTTKQAEKFGYKGSIPGAKKDYKDMSASELSKELQTEI